MDPHSPNKLFATKQYCFLIRGDDTSFFFFTSLFFVLFLLLLLFYVIINFYKNYFIIILFFFHENYYIFRVPGCSRIFRNITACSGMFRVPGFIDAQEIRGPLRGYTNFTSSD